MTTRELPPETDYSTYISTVQTAPSVYYSMAVFDEKGKFLFEESSEHCEMVHEIESDTGWMIHQTHTIHQGLVSGAEVYVGEVCSGKIVKIFSVTQLVSEDRVHTVKRHQFEDSNGYRYVLDVHRLSAVPLEQPKREYGIDYSVCVEDIETFSEALIIAEERHQAIEFFARFLEECLNQRHRDTTDTAYRILTEINALR